MFVPGDGSDFGGCWWPTPPLPKPGLPDTEESVAAVLAMRLMRPVAEALAKAREVAVCCPESLESLPANLCLVV